MKSIFKILILAAVPILAVTMVADQALAADKGSQLIFQSNMAHKSYISIANAHSGQAATVLIQYYNDAMERVLWYLRVLPANSNLLIDPFDHMIPGSDPATNTGDFITSLPAKSTEDNGPGINSGHFVLTVTAVGASISADADGSGKITDGLLDTDPTQANASEPNERNLDDTVNVLFPTFLVDNEDMGAEAPLHGVGNIDNCGELKITVPRPSNVDAPTTDEIATAAINNNLAYTKNGAEGVYDCREDDPATAGEDEDETDTTSKNVGALSVGNAHPISFNHLTGHFTEALISTAEGGSDQTASWGGTPIIRPAVMNTANDELGLDVDLKDDDSLRTSTNSDYQILNGMNEDPDLLGPRTDALLSQLAGGRLAEKDAGGSEGMIANHVSGYTNEGGNTKDTNKNNTADPEEQIITTTTLDDATTRRMQRSLNGGALVLPALHGGGEQSQHIMLMLSAADEFGGAGKYSLIPAKTGYTVSLIDSMGDALPAPGADANPVFGGATNPEAPSGLKIIVEGIRVMVDATKCGGTMIDGPWTLASLTNLVPTASSGASKDEVHFDGLDAMIDPMMNASPGWIKFMRGGLDCKMDFGDGDAATGSSIEDADGVPTTDERIFKAGTLIIEEKMEDRSFVTVGQALLKFITPNSTFAASWSLKSPPSPAN